MVGKIARRDELGANAVEGCVELLWPGDAGEGDYLAADQGSRSQSVRLEAGAQDRLAGHDRRKRIRRCLVAADHDQRLHERRLRRDRRAQRAGGNAEPVAETLLAVDDREGEILGELGILQPVVEDEDARRPPRPPARAACTRSAPTQHGATRASSSGSSPTDPRVVDGRDRPGCGSDALLSAVAARQKRHALAVGDQHLRERDRRRRLAGAAGDEIADADDRRSVLSRRARAIRRAVAAP